MFADKIKKWGIRKNASQAQRKLILEELHGDGDGKELKETSLKLNPGKIERWEREERLAGSLGKSAAEKKNRKEKVVSDSKVAAADRRLADRALSPLREIIEVSATSPKNGKQPQTIWDMADIPGSPKLSRFIDFLKIDEEFPIPPHLSLPPRDPKFITKDDWCDLVKRPVNDGEELGEEGSGALVRTSKKRQRSPSPAELLICKWLLSQIEKPWTPLNEVYPFPMSFKSRKARNGTYLQVLSINFPFLLHHIQLVSLLLLLRR